MLRNIGNSPGSPWSQSWRRKRSCDEKCFQKIKDVHKILAFCPLLPNPSPLCRPTSTLWSHFNAVYQIPASIVSTAGTR